MSKIIVAGLGQVGYRVTRLLCRLGEDVTVITQVARPGFIETVETRGARVLIGDARDQSLLQQAGISIADSLIACSSSDLTNIEIAIDAQSANPEIHIVARIFDVSLGDQLRETVGIRQTLAMSRLAAPKFVAEALQTQGVGHFKLKGQEYLVQLTDQKSPPNDQEIQLDNGKFLTIKPFSPPSETQKIKKKDPIRSFIDWIPKRLASLVLVVTTLAFISTAIFCFGMKLSLIDSLYFVVTSLTTTGYGDITPKTEATWVKLYTCWMMLLGSASVAALYSIVTETLVSSRLEDLTGRQSLDLEDHVVVVGVGNVGYRICQSLTNQGVSTVAIDVNTSQSLGQLLPKSVPFLVGDGRDPNTLMRASISKAKAIVSTTNDDSVNLAIGLAAKKSSENCLVVIRLFDGNFATKVEQSLNIDRALSSASLSAPGFAGAALFPDCIFAFATRHELVIVRDTPTGFKIERRKIERSD